MPETPTNLDAIDLSNEKLKRLAGFDAFALGLDYFNHNPHLVYQVVGSKVMGNISGTDSYHQQLTFARQGLDGHCSCPASDNIDFCKHCVVLALAVRESQTLDPLATAKKPRVSAQERELDCIKQYLSQLTRDDVEASLLSLIHQDKEQFSSWSIRAHAALNPLDSQFLKKKITQAFAINKHLHSHNQVSQYFVQAEGMVDLLVQHSGGLTAQELLSLTDYALNRLDKALLTMDDSGGYRFQCIGMLQRLYVKAIEKQQLDVPQLLKLLLDMLDENSEIKPEIPNAYSHLLGDTGLALLFETVKTRWEAMPAPLSDRKGPEHSLYHHYFLLLKEHAKQSKNHSLLIELQQHSARSTRDLINLTQLLIQKQEWPRAAKTLARAHNSKETHHFKNQLLACDLQLLEHNQAYDEALALLTQHFDQQQTFTLYKQCAEFAAKHALAFDPQAILDHLTANHLIVEIQFYHQRYDELLNIQATQKLPKELLEKLIQAHPNAPEITLPLYETLIDYLVGIADKEHYQQAISALTCAQKDALNPASQWEFGALITRLKARYKAKRNFIKCLNETFGK